MGPSRRCIEYSRGRGPWVADCGDAVGMSHGDRYQARSPKCPARISVSLIVQHDPCAGLANELGLGLALLACLASMACTPPQVQSDMS